MGIKRQKNEYAIQAVENSLDVLEQFKGEKAELGITELSKSLGLHKNNVFRVLATLQNRGYIEQNTSTENYKLGIKVLELSRAFLDHTGLIKVAKPILEELVDVVNENVYLGFLKDNKIVYVEHAESTQVLRVTSRIGTSLSPLCTAIGKVMMSYLSDEECEKIIKVNGFKKFTPKTITDKDIFMKELKKVREQGYSVDEEEYDEGVTCLAYPVRNYEHQIVAGISISGPASRLKKPKQEDFYIPKLKEYGLILSKAIGYLGV